MPDTPITPAAWVWAARAAVQDLQRRVTWLERQHRMLLTALHFNDQTDICVDIRCLNGPVPHMAELGGCPRLSD